MLSVDFESKSREKLQLLLQRAGKASEHNPPAEPAEPPERTELGQSPGPVGASEASAPTLEVDASSVVVNEKVVRLTELNGRRTLLKEVPSSLEAVASDEDLSKFSLEALKRLAKSAALDLPKQINKPTLIAVLADARRRATAEVQSNAEEADAACLR
jgi:hypothetical protein